jgi:VanZ family protein
MHQLLAAPFSWYYEGSEFHALTETMRKALLALPLGVLLRLSWRSGGPYGERLRTIAAATVGLCVLIVIEVGQVFLPSRLPDITDVLIGEAGLLMGAWLTARLTMIRVDQRVAGSFAAPRRP